MIDYSNNIYKAIQNAETDLTEYLILDGNHRKAKMPRQTIQRVTISQNGTIRRNSLLNDF